MGAGNGKPVAPNTHKFKRRDIRVLVTGTEGCGKTSIIAHFLNRSPDTLEEIKADCGNGLKAYTDELVVVEVDVVLTLVEVHASSIHGIDLARMEAAVFVRDASLSTTTSEKMLVDLWDSFLHTTTCVNKIDLSGGTSAEVQLNSYGEPPINVNGLTGEGLDMALDGVVSAALRSANPKQIM